MDEEEELLLDDEPELEGDELDIEDAEEEEESY